MSEEKIYFSDEDIFAKISEILAKNGIQEDLIDAFLKKENESFVSIIINLTKYLIKNEISEKDFLLSLQQQLGVSVQIAENISKDIKEKIVPLAEKITVGDQLSEEKPITAQPTRLINENKNSDENKKSIKTKKNSTKIIEPPVFEEPKETIPKIIQKRGPDSYREPIE